MSTSDSDYSIDWLASDDDDSRSPKRSSPPLTSSSPLASCFHRGATQSRTRTDPCDCTDGGRWGGDADSAAALQTPAVSPVQGFTSVYTRQTLSVESKHHSSRKRARSAGLDGNGGKSQADSENEFFLLKCVELQCYIQPLASILQGLRSGRYSERLSSFQESVAMDRIQRIMGVLQNPNMGGRFLDIILKIEGMLHSWFPHIKPYVTQIEDSTPDKRLKLQHHGGAVSSSPSSDVDPPLAASYSSTHLKWLHTSPICSLKTATSTGSRGASATPPLSPRCRQEVTQDNAVSSSTDLHMGPLLPLGAGPRLRRGPLPFKISSPCLERLLQAKESIIAPRVAGGGAWLS